MNHIDGGSFSGEYGSGGGGWPQWVASTTRPCEEAMQVRCSSSAGGGTDRRSSGAGRGGGATDAELHPPGLARPPVRQMRRAAVSRRFSSPESTQWVGYKWAEIEHVVGQLG
jgi:hypothetical protein